MFRVMCSKMHCKLDASRATWLSWNSLYAGVRTQIGKTSMGGHRYCVLHGLDKAKFWTTSYQTEEIQICYHTLIQFRQTPGVGSISLPAYSWMRIQYVFDMAV